MYVFLYACMHACMYVCMYVRMYVRMYVCIYVCMPTITSVHLTIHTYTGVHQGHPSPPPSCIHPSIMFRCRAYGSTGRLSTGQPHHHIAAGVCRWVCPYSNSGNIYNGDSSGIGNRSGISNSGSSNSSNSSNSSSNSSISNSSSIIDHMNSDGIARCLITDPPH